MTAASPQTRVAVVTGAAGGIGAATCAMFRSRGWTVLGVDHRAPASGEDDRWAADLGAADEVEALIARIRAETRTLDCLVNNAAVQVVKRLVDTSVEEFDRVMAVNVRAGFQLLKGLCPLLRQAAGSVINVSSVHAVATSPGLAAYVTSKGAMAAFTRAAALELAGDGIRVNAVLPGAVDTPMLQAGLSRMTSAEVAAFAASHPVGRIGRPGDIAEAIWFLADGQKSGFMTGATLTVDGGVTARLSTE